MNVFASLVVAGVLGATLGVSSLVWVEPDPQAGQSEPTTAPASSQPATRRVSGKYVNAADDAALNTALAAGKPVELEGTILLAAWSKSGKVMNIAFAGTDGKAPSPGTGLLAAVFPDQRPAFDGAFGGDAAKTLTGKRVRVTGKLTPYGGYDEIHKGAKQVVLKNVTQVTVLN